MFVSPTVVGNAIIIGSCAGSVYSLDRATGNPIWLYDTRADGPRAQFHGEPLLSDDRVVIPSDSSPNGHVYAFDTTSGEVLWKVPFSEGVATTPLLIGKRVVVVSVEGDVAAIDLTSGKIVWTTKPAGKLRKLPFIPSPTHVANRILMADNTNQIIAVDASKGDTLWRQALPGRPNTSLAVNGEEVIVGTADGYLNRMTLKSGKVTKRTKLGGTPYGSLARSHRLLLVLVSGGTSELIALDATTHEVRWRQETPKEWTTYRPLITPSVVIAGNEEKELCAFDRETGERRWCRTIGEIPRGLGMSEDGIVYVGSLRGIVQAFHIKDLARQ